jgi:hypothetical protein
MFLKEHNYLFFKKIFQYLCFKKVKSDFIVPQGTLLVKILSIKV